MTSISSPRPALINICIEPPAGWLEALRNGIGDDNVDWCLSLEEQSPDFTKFIYWAAVALVTTLRAGLDNEVIDAICDAELNGDITAAQAAQRLRTEIARIDRMVNEG